MTPRFAFNLNTAALPSDTDLTIPLKDLVDGSIKYALSCGKTPLKLGATPTGTSHEELCVRTLLLVFRSLCQQQYQINEYNTNDNFALMSAVNNQTDRQVLAYLENQEPISIDSLFLLLSIYKHLALSQKDKYREVLYGTNKSYYNMYNTLYYSICVYLDNNYIHPNLVVKQKLTPYSRHAYSAVIPLQYTHAFWKPLERWLVNDKPFEHTARLVVSSGLVTLFQISQSGRYLRLLTDASFLNLLVSEDITEEFVSDILSIPFAPMHIAQQSPNRNAEPLVGWNIVPARAEVIKSRFKRFNRIRTQKLMLLSYLIDNIEEFGTDIMGIEFDATTRLELVDVVNRYKQWKTSELAVYRGDTHKKYPAFKYLEYCADYYKFEAEHNANLRFTLETAPAVAIAEVMSSVYNYANNYAILESHLREYR